jgi:hypothetical protein
MMPFVVVHIIPPVALVHFVVVVAGGEGGFGGEGGGEPLPPPLPPPLVIRPTIIPSSAARI